MKAEITLLFHLLALHLLSQMTESQTTDKPPPVPICNTDFLRTYRLKGQSRGNTTDPFLICPSITSNCCSKYDQRYVFHYMQDIIPQRLVELKARRDMAFERLRKFHTKIIRIPANYSQVGETKGLYCATQWRGLLNFDFTAFYKKYIDFSNNWIEDRKTYMNSFYCMLCDAKNHLYFDTLSIELTISQSFCKRFLESNQDDIRFWINDFFKYVRNLQNVVDCNHYTSAFNLTFFNPEKLVEFQKGSSCLRTIDSQFGDDCRYMCNKIGLATTTTFLDGDPIFIEEVVNLFEQSNSNQERGRFISMEMREYYKRFELVKTLNTTERGAFTQMITRSLTPIIQGYDPVELFQQNIKVPRMMRLNAMKRKLLEGQERRLAINQPKANRIKNSMGSIFDRNTQASKTLSPFAESSPYIYQKPSHKNSEFLKDSFVQKTNLLFSNMYNDSELLQNGRRLQSVADSDAKAPPSDTLKSVLTTVRTPQIQLNGYDDLVYDQILVEPKNIKNLYFYDILVQPLDVDKISRKFGSDAGVSMDYKPIELIMDSKAFYEMLFKARQPDSWNLKIQVLLDSFYPTFMSDINSILDIDCQISTQNYLINPEMGLGRKLKLNSKKNRKLIREISTV